MELSKFECRKYYRDYLNNFLTIRYFAEYYGFTIKDAMRIILRGRMYEKL